MLPKSFMTAVKDVVAPELNSSSCGVTKESLGSSLNRGGGGGGCRGGGGGLVRHGKWHDIEIAPLST